MSTLKYYVYIIFRLDGSPCYIGKGCGKRWRDHFKPSRQTTKNNIHLARIIALSGGELPALIIRSGMTNEEACAMEIAFIAAIGRADKGLGPLVNVTDGGEGPRNRVVSEATREKLRRWRTGRKQSPEHAAAGALARIGGKRSEETKAKMRAAALGNRRVVGKKRTLATCERISASKRGKPRTEEAKRAMRQGWAQRNLIRKWFAEQPVFVSEYAKWGDGSSAGLI